MHIADVLEDRDLRTDILSGINFRTGLGVPLVRKGELIGLLVLSREKPQPFSRRQIELVETFADQAVIAIENTRLFEAEQVRTKELAEALERQTATSEVLSVISSSHGELEPVYQAMLANAVRICEAKFGVLFRYGDGVFRPVASADVPLEYAESMRQRRRQISPDTLRHSRPSATEQGHSPDRRRNGRTGPGSCRQARWRALTCRRADVQGERTCRRHYHLPPGSAAVYR